MSITTTTLPKEQEKESDNNFKNEGRKIPVKYKKVPPDGGWGWLVVFGTVIINLLISGFMKAFGLLFVELLDEFNSTTFAATYIPALSYFLHCSLGPMGSYLSTKYSYRCVTLIGAIFVSSGMILSVFGTSITHLYLTYGVLVGVGGSLTLPIGIYIVNSYFVRYKGLASGIAVSGSVIGSIIIPPLLSHLLDTYRVRGTMLIMGGIMLNTIIGALLYHPVEWHMKKVPILDENEVSSEPNCVVQTKEEESVENKRDTSNGETCNIVKSNSEFNCQLKKEKEPSKWWWCRAWDREVLKISKLLQQPLFILLLLSNVIASISYANLLILLPVHTIDRNFNKLMASYLLSIVAIFDFLGRISGSTISDWLPYNKMYYYITGILMAGTSLIFFPLAKSYLSLCIFSGIFGLSTGTHIGAILVTLIEILGEDKLKHSLSVLFFVKGVVHLIGMPICGFVYERTKSYVVIIRSLGFMLIIAAIVWIIISRLPRKIRHKKFGK